VKNSGQLAKFWTPDECFMVGAPRFELGTPCTPCESSIARKCLTDQLKLPLESSRIISQSARLSLGFAKNWLGNSGRLLSSAQVEYIRVSGLTDAAVARVLRRSLTTVRRARIGLTHSQYPVRPDRAPREGAGRRASPIARPARVRRSYFA